MKGHTGRHTQFYAAVIIGALVFAAALALRVPLSYTLGANAFFVAYSGSVLIEMRRMTPAYLKKHARAADLPVLFIFATTFVIVAAAVVALFDLINARGAPEVLELVLALASVVLGWFTIQAMCAVHYAHLYWSSEGKGGLDFPGDEEPGGVDFLYFAATIGMTAQTADTAVTSRHMRRTVLMHAIVSFLFNTVIVAAAVNIAVSIGGQ